MKENKISGKKRNCLVCNKTFIPKSKGERKGMQYATCSEKCKIQRRKDVATLANSKKLAEKHSNYVDGKYNLSCQICEQPFRNKHPFTKFCSPVCYKKNVRKKVRAKNGTVLRKFNCPVCNVIVEKWASPSSEFYITTCSKKECIEERKSRLQYGNSKTHKLTCANCKTPFKMQSRKDKPRQDWKYCSDKCCIEGNKVTSLHISRMNRKLLSDVYVASLLQNDLRKGGIKVSKSHFTKVQIENRRIATLIARAVKLENHLNDPQAVKDFEETLTRTLRGNKAIMPK